MYKSRLIAHLVQYRRDVLGIQHPGVFRYRGRDVFVEHVLPKKREWLNIPPTAREQVRLFVEARSGQIKLHRYFHHLNSSQAFALALFVPFFESGTASASALLAALGRAGQLASWQPEAIPNKEEGTNVDAYWRTVDGVDTFCEVKLTEAEFGAAKDDARHLDKLRRIYAPRLAPHVDASLLTPAAFFPAYQILRNLWHAAGTATGRVLFVFPRQHVALDHQLAGVLSRVAPSMRSRVAVAHPEDVLTRLAADPQLPRTLRNYAGELVRKYVPSTP